MKSNALNATRPSSQLTHGALTRHFVGRVKLAMTKTVLRRESSGCGPLRKFHKLAIPLAAEVSYFLNRIEACMADSTAPETEEEIMRRGVALLAKSLPSEWSAEFTPQVTGRPVDNLLRISAPSGQTSTMVVEAKRVVVGRDVPVLRERLDVLALGIPDAKGIVFARYLSPPVRTRLANEGLSYVDATGNMRVELDSPALFLSDRGADRDPWRGPGRPRGTLKGEPAARIVRALADFAEAWTIRQLVDVANTSTGSTYRVIDYLESEGLANRDQSGLIRIADWVQLLRRWSDDYGFVRNSTVTRWIAPRGLSDLMSRMATSDTSLKNYALTGTLAAQEWAAYATARSAMIYVKDAEEAATSWGLRPADAGANVMLAEPKIDVVFERTLSNEAGLELAAPSQVVVDLMTGPGRSPSEAEELLGWMRQNEKSWRT